MCLLIAVNQFGFGAIVPVVALYAEGFGVSQTAIGLTIAVYGLARFLVNVPAGHLADRFGRRTTLAAGGLTTVVGASLCAVAPDYPIFLIARFIAGAGAACVLTGGQIVLADISSPHNRGRMMAVYQGVFLFSVGAGAVPGGFLAARFGLASPFWANAALAGAAAVLAWFAVPETRDRRSGPAGAGSVVPSVKPPRIGAQWRTLAATDGFLLISLVSFAAFFARTGALFNVIPLLADREIGLATDQIGIGLGMSSIVVLVLSYPSGALVDRFGRKAVIVPSTILSGAGMLAFGFAGSFGAFLLACALWSAASGVSSAAPAAYAADIAPSGMTAAALGTYRTIADFGYVAGPLALGALADLISADAALALTAALLVGTGAAFARFAPETLPGPDRPTGQRRARGGRSAPSGRAP
ncbi:MAG: MFS transporter [Chloroflexia bacterium]|nr:MFS transporter [Chloroflexia bacterium]